MSLCKLHKVDHRFLECNAIQCDRKVGKCRYQTCSTFYLVQATWAKFGLHADNVKYITQNEKDRQCMYNVPLRRVRATAVAVKKAISITYSVCVCVCLCVCVCIQCACAILSSVAGPALQYFSTLSHKRHELKKKKKFVSIKRVFLFSLQCLSKTFLILRRIK